jgi:hypothetical protein
MQKSKDKVSTAANIPVAFPRWREVLISECSDPVELRARERDIFAWLKFLKATHRRASVEFVLDYPHSLEEVFLQENDPRKAHIPFIGVRL